MTGELLRRGELRTSGSLHLRVDPPAELHTHALAYTYTYGCGTGTYVDGDAGPLILMD